MWSRTRSQFGLDRLKALFQPKQSYGSTLRPWQQLSFQGLLPQTDLAASEIKHLLPLGAY